MYKYISKLPDLKIQDVNDNYDLINVQVERIEFAQLLISELPEHDMRVYQLSCNHAYV